MLHGTTFGRRLGLSFSNSGREVHCCIFTGCADGQKFFGGASLGSKCSARIRVCTLGLHAGLRTGVSPAAITHVGLVKHLVRCRRPTKNASLGGVFGAPPVTTPICTPNKK